jgi:ribose/xylose/arabinose/galactoside ABC-type transport system permease subunit
VDTSRIFTAQATQGGSALTFTVLAGVVVGGTSILGGEGAIWRTVVGVLFIALIGNGFDLLSIDPWSSRSFSGSSCCWQWDSTRSRGSEHSGSASAPPPPAPERT